MSIWLPICIFALYGLACLVGGIIGYLKAGSVPSLAAGVPSGVLLLCAAGVLWQPTAALVGAIIVAVLVGGFFSSNLVKHRHELRSWSGTRRSIVMAIGAGVVVIIAGIALTGV